MSASRTGKSTPVRRSKRLSGPSMQSPPVQTVDAAMTIPTLANDLQVAGTTENKQVTVQLELIHELPISCHSPAMKVIRLNEMSNVSPSSIGALKGDIESHRIYLSQHIIGVCHPPSQWVFIPRTKLGRITIYVVRILRESRKSDGFWKLLGTGNKGNKGHQRCLSGSKAIGHKSM